jgi:transposase-like protein
MPKRRWTAERRAIVLDSIARGASQREACRLAKIDEGTLRHWLRRGEAAADGGTYREFANAFALAAELAEQRAAAEAWRRLAHFQTGHRLAVLEGGETGAPADPPGGRR